MTFYVTNQNVVVASLLVLGVLLGFLFDIFQVPISFCKRISLFVFLFDVLYCLAGCVVFVIVIYITNYGYVRWYEFLSVALGMWAYRVVFDWHISDLLVFFTRKLFGFVRFVISTALLPIRILFKLVQSSTGAVVGCIHGVTCKLIIDSKCRGLYRKHLKESQNGFGGTLIRSYK